MNKKESSDIKDFLYHYKAIVTDNYDGDSITVDISLGFYAKLEKQKVRLYGIDTPEIRGEERSQGLIVKAILADMILGKEVVIETYKDSKEKYGRWLATVWIDGLNVNQWLIENGYAKEYVE